jgi:hypothetical protein
MLLVTFHGGSGGQPNVWAYDTATGVLTTKQALQDQGGLLAGAELRGLVYANSFLYVVNGAKNASNILCYGPSVTGVLPNLFQYVGVFLGPSLSHNKGHFQNSIGHPYALQFATSGGSTYVYVSNQDTNVVARATVAAGNETASIPSGCQSAYLNELTSICPKGECVYLDGTFVASQCGTLPDVTVAATNVPECYGGLSVAFSDGTTTCPPQGKVKVQNSVRDVAVSGGVLLVCDEPSKVIRLYSLPDGTSKGPSPKLPASPTHLAIFSNGLYVSAGDQLYWSALGNPPDPSGLSFQSLLTAPSGYSVGGVTFGTVNDAATAYVAFQKGKGTKGSGTIYAYDPGATPASPPVFGAGSLFATISADTPEFLLFVPVP